MNTRILIVLLLLYDRFYRNEIRIYSKVTSKYILRLFDIDRLILSFREYRVALTNR